MGMIMTHYRNICGKGSRIELVHHRTQWQAFVVMVLYLWQLNQKLCAILLLLSFYVLKFT